MKIRVAAPRKWWILVSKLSRKRSGTIRRLEGEGHRGIGKGRRAGTVEVMEMGLKNSIFRLKTSEVEHISVMTRSGFGHERGSQVLCL